MAADRNLVSWKFLEQLDPRLAMGSSNRQTVCHVIKNLVSWKFLEQLDPRLAMGSSNRQTMCLVIKNLVSWKFLEQLDSHGFQQPANGVSCHKESCVMEVSGTIGSEASHGFQHPANGVYCHKPLPDLSSTHTPSPSPNTFALTLGLLFPCLTNSSSTLSLTSGSNRSILQCNSRPNIIKAGVFPVALFGDVL
ncbi:uncharacterized protein LOC120354691 [Nilaparvata lugens]|uniref:uncharacterized protein LOC120354691 n=1 Tax=Nilaparvata lugens TaxID=108931 RepID=UPI00193E31C1|nr:uncharacterized protein LOC120354691 [Nilaparvata lugens]